MDINPEELINSLSSQIGALTTENTMLKMALAKMQQELQAAVVPEVEVVQEKKKK
jgi:regulator of replication initiation timing